MKMISINYQDIKDSQDIALQMSRTYTSLVETETLYGKEKRLQFMNFVTSASLREGDQVCLNFPAAHC